MSVLTDLVAAISSDAIEVIDLTAPLSSQTPILKLPEPLGQTWRFELSEISRYNEAGPAWYWNNIKTGEHTGTHLDAPIHILRADGLGHLESDLIHALLLLQRRDAALQRRVVRFLRCEGMSAYEQRLLGGLAPRDQPEDPMRTIQQLGSIAYELQLASLVLLVDQIEDTVPDGRTVTRLQQAIDVLRGVADAVPSIVVVISCLDDVYTALSGLLSRRPLSAV